MTTSTIPALASPWDLAPRFELGLHSPLLEDGWAWRHLPLEHPALANQPKALRANDPGEALQVISSAYGEPSSYCVLGGNVASVSGWDGISFDEQYAAVAGGAGAFPCGGMLYLSVTGPDAVDVLGLLTPRAVDHLEVGQAAFVLFTTPEGTVDTEGVVLRAGPESFQLSVGGDTRPPTWLQDAMAGHRDVEVHEAELSSFNIKGPRRLDAMLRLVDDGCAGPVTGLRPFRAVSVRTRWGGRAWILRTLIGMEMWADPETIHEAWHAMVARPDLVMPCGWDVLATFRIECQEFAFYLCPLDINRGTHLYDAGLRHAVSRAKDTPFVGREALLGPEPTAGHLWVGGLTGLAPDTPARWVGEPLRTTAGEDAGYVTSAAYSPRAGRQVCFAHLPLDVRPGDTVSFGDGGAWRASTLPMAPRPPAGEAAGGRA